MQGRNHKIEYDFDDFLRHADKKHASILSSEYMKNNM